MIVLLRQLVLMTMLGGTTTAGAVYMARSATGMDRDLHNQVSVRQATPMAGRIILGGGLRGGK